VTVDDLQDDLVGFGAINPSSGTLNTIVTVPVSISMVTSSGDTFSAATSVGLAYKATHNKAASGQYVFGKHPKGQTVSGYFVISKVTVAEGGTAGDVTHGVSITGRLLLPGGAQFNPATTGSFIFDLGNCTYTVNAADVTIKGGLASYAAKGAVSGVKQFSINVHTGSFTLDMTKIPAKGTNGSGIPVSKVDNIINVRLNLSFVFDLSNQELDAGRYISISRKNSLATTWKLTH
jgi:hypothetical protein